MSRLSAGLLVWCAETMPERERELIEVVARLRLVSAKQLERLFFAGVDNERSRGRAVRRVLAGLREQRILVRLERRIGGVRAGSAGHVYGLGPVGKRLLAYWRGQGLVVVRTPYEPSSAFVRHTLAIAEHYVRLIEAERQGRYELVAFQSEPRCYREFIGASGQVVVLKPDAFVHLGVGDFMQLSFLEVDCGTEGRGALMRKCQRYVSYFRSGVEQAKVGVFPRVVWSTTNQARVALLVDVCASLPADAWELFVVGTPERAIELLCGESAQEQVS